MSGNGRVHCLEAKDWTNVKAIIALPNLKHTLRTAAEHVSCKMHLTEEWQPPPAERTVAVSQESSWNAIVGISGLSKNFEFALNTLQDKIELHIRTDHYKPCFKVSWKRWLTEIINPSNFKPLSTKNWRCRKVSWTCEASDGSHSG